MSTELIETCTAFK